MHSLLGRYFSGEATEAEKEAVKKWSQASEQNRIEFTEFEALWNRYGVHNPVPFDADKAWQKIDTRINTPIKKSKIVSIYAQRIGIGIAASLLLLFAIWSMMGNRNDIHTVTADTDVQEVRLEDGSRVYLRKGSSLKFPAKFAGNNRKVSLTGKGFFEVNPDAAKPFIITAAETEVSVVGTSFLINTLNQEVELIVKTGRVNFNPIANTAQKVLVIAGERALYAKNSISKSVNGDKNFNAWQTRQLVFENTPLQQVIATLNDYYNVTITLKKEDSDQLSAANVTVTFQNQSLSSVLDELSLTTTYHIQKITDTNYEISIK